MQDDNRPPGGGPENNGDRRLPAPSQGGALSLAHSVTPASLLAELRQGEQRNEDEIDLMAYWRILVRRRWVVLSLLGAALFAAAVVTLLSTPIYRATTSLQIDRQSVQVVQVEGMSPGEIGVDRDFYQTQYELLKSRSLAQRVASQLALASDPTVAELSRPSPWRAMLASILGGRDDGEPARARADIEYASVVLDGLTIEPVRNSRLVRVHFDSPSPEFSQRVAQAVADAFIATNLERRFDSSAYAKGYLEERLAELKVKLEDSERQLVSFAQQEGIVTSGQGSANLTEQSLSALNGAVAEAREDRIRAEAVWRSAQASPDSVLLGQTGQNSIGKALQERRAELLAEYQDKLRLYKPGYPLMVQLKGQIDEVDGLIATEVKRVTAALQAEYVAAQARESSLVEQLETLKSEALDLQGRSIQYTILKREVDTNRELYDGLLQRYKEIGVAGGVSTNNVSVVDRAMLPAAPIKPRPALNLALGLLLGLMAGVGLALLLEYLDDTIKSGEDVEQKLRLVQLGMVPKLGKDSSPQRALGDQRSAFAEAYRSLRTALQFSTETGVPKVLLVTSSIPGEGKSTTAYVLAQKFSQLGKRVLVIDADLRNPSLHRMFGVENGKGLTNCLTGTLRPVDCLHNVSKDGIAVLTSGPLPPNPAELLASARMMSLLTKAMERYDQIVIDAPPVLGLADSPILANIAGGTLLVVESGRTRVGAAQAAIKRLLTARARVLGVVLTKLDLEQQGYGYSYQYDYYQYGGKQPKRLAGRR